MTKQLENKFKKYPLYSQENTELDDHVVVCKFFNPYGAGTWLAFEGEKLSNGDWRFFGAVKIFDEYELGYFCLSELQSVKINVFGVKMGLERDTFYDKRTDTYKEFLN